MDQVARALLAAGGGAAPAYVDDVFSTYLYSGTGASQTINNGIDLAGKGGLVWFKRRDNNFDHKLMDTARGAVNELSTNLTTGQVAIGNLDSFNSNGFSLSGGTTLNGSGALGCSWTFRKAAKFFDIVTYTGNGTTQNIAHNLGAVPGCIIVKDYTSGSTNNWSVYHRSIGATKNLYFSSPAILENTGANYWNNTEPTATQFSLSASADVNGSGKTYVAYLFAHDTATDGLIQCGSYTGPGSSALDVNLGFEPQWLFVQQTNFGTDSAGQAIYIDPTIFDFMRGFPAEGQPAFGIRPNVSAGELSSGAYGNNTPHPTATGFRLPDSTGSTLGGTTAGSGLYYSRIGANYVYIAIRRPNKPPTTGTQVFNAIARTGNDVNTDVTAGFPVDLVAVHMRNGVNNQYVGDRLRGSTLSLEFSDIDAETSRPEGIKSMASNTGFTVGWYSDVNASPNTYANWCFRRAPGFFDVVCYTGNGVSTRMLEHNLGVQPELIITKCRNTTGDWQIAQFPPGVTTTSGTCYWFHLFGTSSAIYTGTIDFNFGPTFSAPNASTYPTGAVGGTSVTATNVNNNTYVAYLFASRPGISKVGSYTGNGGTQNVDCGFATGARFVLIKRTDSAGNWCVHDSARGITSSTDPLLTLNTTNPETAAYDNIAPFASGFQVWQNPGENLNVTGATYIYLAIA